MHAFGQPRGRWGYCDKPLVDGDSLLITPGGSQATVVAVDKLTGNIRWKKLIDKTETFDYASPVVITTEGRKQYVVTLSKGIVGLDAHDGRLLWRYEGVSSSTANSYTPLVLDGGLLCPNGYSTGVARLRLHVKDGGIQAEEVYKTKHSLDPFEDSSIIVDQRLFVFGSGGLPGCIDVRTGEWLSKPKRGSGLGKAAATYADGRLYARWTDGTLALLDAGSADYVEKGRFALPDPRKGLGVTFPVVTGGRMYVRDNDRLYCYDVRKHLSPLAKSEPRFVSLPTPKKEKASTLERGLRAIFVPTPADVVQKMLEVAGVHQDDCVYDLGSGDSRILIAAAQKYQCQAVGIELDAKLVKESQAAIDAAKLNSLVTVKQADFFEADLADATVVAAYLYPSILQNLTPKLSKLKPGTRIVTHQFTIPGYQPDAVVTVESKETGAAHSVYLWTVPLRARPMRDASP